MIKLVILALGSLLAYFFYKPYLKTKESRNQVFKLHLIICIGACIFYLFVHYILQNDEVESFSKGVASLKANKEIQSKIGTFESYSFHIDEMPSKTDDPAFFKICLKGSKAIIYLSCKIQKKDSLRWHLIEVKEDSIRLK